MHRLLAAAVFAASGALLAPAFAQAPPAAPPGLRIMGVLTAVSPASVTVKQADGTNVVVGLPMTISVIEAKPVDIDAIKPGTYVATANTNVDANSGKSIELRMFATPGGASFSRPMAQANTTMTNGTVSTITKGAGGRELDVAYPGGSRHIVVPPDVKVIGNYPAAVKDLSVGENVSVNAAKDPSGATVGTRITINRS